MDRAKVSLKKITSDAKSLERGYRWIVYYPAANPDQPRRRKRFKLKAKAEEFQLEKQNLVRQSDAGGAGMTASESTEAAKALSILRPYGVNLIQAAQAYVERLDAASRSVTAREAIEEMIEVKKAAGRSKKHTYTLRTKLNRFEEAFGERLLSEITVDEIDRWLLGLDYNPTTKRGIRLIVVSLFTWAEKRGYCKGNAASATEAPAALSGEPEIFTPGEARIVLNEAPADLLPMLAMGAFAGLRPGEAEALRWEDIDRQAGEIRVKPIGKKGASLRFVPINEALEAWLEPYSQTDGPLRPSDCAKKFKAFRNKLRERGKPVEWKQSVLRHSYASYLHALEESSARVSFLLGHKDQDTIHNHYRNAVPKSEARKYFAIRPKKGRKIIPMEVAS